MYLKKIEIQGFKSFARKTALEFDRGIISVVGPNGSGKSNFSDAIRWVLGEQSMKAIRSKKSEDVIFAGSDKKSKLGMAEVSITFDNEDRKLPVDFSEVVITRRLFRDGESEYLINQRPVRLMDIVELLAKSGFGNNSYHVISQGTIDQMIIAGPAAIKNIIEEASGVKPYYTKRERSVRKLESSEQNLLRIRDLVAEIEPRLRSLKRQAKRMEQREELSARLRALQQNFFAASYQTMQRTAETIGGKVANFENEIQVITKTIGLAEQSVKALETASSRRAGEYVKLQSLTRDLERNKNRIVEDLAMIRGQLKVKSPGLAPDRQAVQIRILEMDNSIQSLATQAEILRDSIILSEKNLADHKKILSRLESDSAKLKRGLETGKSPADIVRLKEDIEKVYSAYQSLLYQMRNMASDDDFTHLQSDANNLEISLVKLKDRAAKFSDAQLHEAELNQLNQQLQAIFSKKENLQSDIIAITVTENTARSKREFFQAQIEDLKRQQEALQSQFSVAGNGGRDKDWDSLAQREKELAKKLRDLESQLELKDLELKKSIETESSEKRELLVAERQLREYQDQLSKLKDQRGLAFVERARSEGHLESLLADIRKSLGQEFVEKIKQFPPTISEPSAEQKIQSLRNQLDSIGGVDELAMQEYRETEARHGHLVAQSEDLQKAVVDLRQVIAELDEVIKKQFQNGFDKINDQFTEYFRVLFSGGRARMSLIRQRPQILPDQGGLSEAPETDDDEAPPESFGVSGKEEVIGIDVRATPPGKKLTSLSALSGGERTLTTIALLMSILTAFPSPFVVLDEVDAALDEANSIRFGKIISKLAHQTQFITITHNRETMRQAGALYGVTMGDDGISKVLSIKLDKAVEIAA